MFASFQYDYIFHTSSASSIFCMLAVTFYYLQVPYLQYLYSIDFCSKSRAYSRESTPSRKLYPAPRSLAVIAFLWCMQYAGRKLVLSNEASIVAGNTSDRKTNPQTNCSMTTLGQAKNTMRKTCSISYEDSSQHDYPLITNPLVQCIMRVFFPRFL